MLPVKSYQCKIYRQKIYNHYKLFYSSATKKCLLATIFFSWTVLSIESPFGLRGPSPMRKKLYYLADCDENAHRYVKLKIKWGNFFYFLQRKSFSQKTWKKGGAAKNRTVKRFNLNSWFLCQTKRNFLFYKLTESFFRILF